MTRLGGDPADVLGPLVRPERSGRSHGTDAAPTQAPPRRRQRMLKAIDELTKPGLRAGLAKTNQTIPTMS